MNAVMILIVALYFILTLSIGILVSRREKNLIDDYFLAGRKLPWYAVSLSMTGSNIGTEHFIGMVGTAYAFGLAPATFEWGNFIPYSVLLWIFLPYFFRKKLYTIPEFLERRYTSSTRAVFAALSLLHMVFAVLAPALYAGGRILYDVTHIQPLVSFNWIFMLCILIISAITAAYCIYGGLLSVVWTDALQVSVLLIGGLILLFFGLDQAGGLGAVIRENLAADPRRFSLIREISHPVSPWTGVATFWLTLSLWYVGTNQFYIQRCLGAKSEWDAKMGVIGCAGLKIFLPAIIVFPGMIAFVLFGPGLDEDGVYIKMINELLPPVARGILLAALIAAIMSTVSSVLNSASTIWSMDVYKRLLRRDATESQLVAMGRWSTLMIIIIGTLMAPVLLFWKGGIFIYIQDMAAFFAPPIAVIFLAAFLWPRAHGSAATLTLVFGIVTGVVLKIYGLYGDNAPVWLQPLLNRAAISWGLCFIVLVVLSLLLPGKNQDRYDKDIIWNLQWAKLPVGEKKRSRGTQSLVFWWALVMIASIALFVLFR